MRNQKGSILIETLFACILLVIIFAGMTEIAFLTRDEIGIIRAAREGAREASLTGSLSQGEAKAREVAGMYLSGPVEVRMKTEDAGNGEETVVCEVSYTHRPFIDIWGIGGRQLSEEARFHFQDYTD